MKNYIKILLFILFCQNASAQDSLIGKFPFYYGYRTNSIKVNNLLLINDGVNTICFDINTRESSRFENSNYIGKLQNNLLFSKTNNSINQRIFLAIDSNRNILDSMPYATPIMGDSFMYFVLNAKEVWKSDGTNANTSKLFTANDTIGNLTIVGNKLFFTTANLLYNVLYSYDFNSPPMAYDTIDATQYNLYFAQANNSSIYIYSKIVNTYNYVIFKSELVNNSTRLFLHDVSNKLKFTNTQNVYTLGNVVTKIDTVTKVKTDIININTPPYYGYAYLAGYSNNYTNDSIFKIQSGVYGMELMRFTKDSLQLFDIAKGIGSSTSLFDNEIVTTNKDTIYTVATNNADSNVYLYKLYDNVIQSICPINSNTTSILYNNGNLFYTVSGVGNSYDSLLLYKKTNLHITNPQPIKQAVAYNAEEWTRYAGYWIQDYGSNSNFLLPVFNNIDTLGNVISCFKQNYYFSNRIILSDMDSSNVAYGDVYINKRDKYGKLIWNTSLGYKKYTYNLNTECTIDKNNDIIVSYISDGNCYFENDSILADSNIKWDEVWIVAKISGATGKVIWKKKILDVADYNYLELDNITVDNDNNIAVSFVSYKGNLTIQPFHIYNNLQPFNALIILDNNGEIKTLKNISTPWTNDWGNTKELLNNPNTNQVIAIQTQGGYNTWSSCAYMNWETYIQSLNNNGDKVFDNHITCTDLGGVMHACINKENKLIMTGYFRGTISMGNFKEVSPFNNSCNEWASFIAVLNLTTNSFELLSVADSVFYPFAITNDDSCVYVLGAYPTNHKYHCKYLSVNKYNHTGVLLGTALIDSSFNFELGDWGAFTNTISNSKNHIVVQYQNPKDSYSAVNGYTTVDGCFMIGTEVVKKIRKDFNFKSLYPITQNVIDNGFQIYPNPATETIYIWSLNNAFTAYEIFDISGKIIQKNTFSTSKLQTIDIHHLPSAMYFVKLIGPNTIKSAKFIKE